jgi:hypothetical protein
MRYIPSPISIRYETVYTDSANSSGRMQYHRILPGVSKQRISRTDFIKAYNDLPILAIKPLQKPKQDAIFEFEFYI